MGISGWLGWVGVVGVASIAFGLYLAGAFRERIQYRFKNLPSPRSPHFPLILSSLSNSCVTCGSFAGFWMKASEIYSARWDAIRNARRTIHFETYDMGPGRRADEFAKILLERAKAGVEVQLIVDNYGAKSIPKSYWHRLQNGGVEVRRFHTFPWRSPLDNLARTHRKLLLIDGETALVGGAGISDKWDGEAAPWLDFEIRLTGEVVAVLEGMFWQNWSYVGGVADLREDGFHSASKSGDATMLVTPGDPSYRNSPISALVQMNLLAARERVWIASPYLLPNDDLCQTLIRSRQNGIDVCLLTMGRHSDKKYVYYAARERYRDLLDGGVEIYEYEPSMMHAKAILVDRDWVSVGSANLDPRSLFLNDELNIAIARQEIVEKFEGLFQEAFAKSNRITRNQWQRRSLWQRALGRLALIFVRQL
ncbi:MAG: phospholipase D-like domain-containing protein [Cyanobacteriota bacterium]|nr:phospholipase D-like domain-containing protein [Cyanobacteriota bacterium]